MKSLKSSQLAVLALNVILTSCSCNSEKGSDYFSTVNPNSAGNITAIGLNGGADGGVSAGTSGSTAGATSAGATNGGATAAGATAGGATAAGASTAGSTSGTVVTTLPTAPSDKDICDPLKDESEEILLGHGLVGKLFDAAPNKIEHFSDLVTKGSPVDGLIYMSKLNIPTRKFDKGFPREDGSMVVNNMGKVLIENFGIEFTGQLELQAGDEPGYYEIGLLADDGVILDIQASNESVSIISGDHYTPTKFFCSQSLVRMEAGKSVPIRLKYFQGPRYHIALIMIWRKVQALEGESAVLIKNQVKNPIKETRCGIAGNNFFFDPESNSHPQMEYLDLLDPTKRVIPWEVVKHKNFRLPVGYSNMQCVNKKP